MDYKITWYLKDEALTAEEAKEILGWEVVEGSLYLLKNTKGEKIRTTHNEINRPFYRRNMLNLKQEILQKRWKFNGEPIIVGNKGAVLNGQHTLIALVLAVEEWTKDPEEFPQWEEEPTIEKLFISGIEEEDTDAVNTLDSCRKRSVADSIYRSPVFREVPSVHRKKVARATSYAIQTIWERTGESSDLSRTNSELLAFLEKHPLVLDSVDFITDEDEDKRLSKYLSPGYLSGMHYLMASSDTKNSDNLDFSKWDFACDFFQELGSNNKSFKGYREFNRKLKQRGLDSLRVKQTLLAKAWWSWLETRNTDGLKLRIGKDNYGMYSVRESVSVGGIDRG